MTEYQQELINEILAELERIKSFVEIKDQDAFDFSEQRIKILAKLLQEYKN